MSRFEQVAQAVAEDSYLKEWLGKVTRIIDDYSPAELTEDKIIETVANSMIARSGDDVPNDNDRIFFTKILWVVIEGTVVLVNRDEAYVDIGYKTEINLDDGSGII